MDSGGAGEQDWQKEGKEGSTHVWMEWYREDSARGQNVMNLQTWYVGGDVCQFFFPILFSTCFFLFLHR